VSPLKEVKKKNQNQNIAWLTQSCGERWTFRAKTWFV